MEGSIYLFLSMYYNILHNNEQKLTKTTNIFKDCARIWDSIYVIIKGQQNQ